MQISKASLDKSKIRFLSLKGIHRNAVDTLKAVGYANIEYLKTAFSGDELKERIADAHFISIRSRTQPTEEVFDCAKRLIAVGCFCTGTSQVDLNAARKRGIAVFDASYSNTHSMAEPVLAEAILLPHGVPGKNVSCHRGGWIKDVANFFEIRGKRLGIVGCDSIGIQLSVLAEVLDIQVFFYNTVTKLPLGNTVQIDSLHELLGISGIVSLHVPELSFTQWMIGEGEIRAMKKSGILINTTCGIVVELDHLAVTIKDKHLIGAVIDVFPVEPKSNDEELASPSCGLDRMILTLHIGGSTTEVQASIGPEVMEKLVRYNDNGTSVSSANLPEVALPSHPDKHRLLHTHANVPGVMSEINKVFADNGISVSSRYLQINDRVGYMMIDVDIEYSDLVLEKLQQVNGTIRSRVLL